MEGRIVAKSILKEVGFKLTYDPVSFMPIKCTKEEWQNGIMAIEKTMMQSPKSFIGPKEVDRSGVGVLKHSFVDGAYIRQITMQKGALFTSQIHKVKHPYFILEGDCSVLTEKGTTRIKAPFWGVTERGAKRLLYIHEKTIWVTVHVTKETDLDAIKKDIIAETFEELDSGHLLAKMKEEL